MTLYAFGVQAPIFSASEWPPKDPGKADESRQGVVRLGYLRRGERVIAKRDVIAKANCAEGWYELASGGFVLVAAMGDYELAAADANVRTRLADRLAHAHRRCDRFELRLQLLDPRLVLQRGYALMTDVDSGHPITSARDAPVGLHVRAALADGEVDLRVLPPAPNGA